MGDVSLIVLPAAFTHTTGRAHWQVLLRARAIENQCYVLASAQGGTHPHGRKTWGESIIIDPWGEVLASLPEGPGWWWPTSTRPASPGCAPACRPCAIARSSNRLHESKAHEQEPAPNPLKTASKLLLKPYDLDFEDLDKVFSKLFRHKLDYADLYFQYHRSEAWSLEEGIVKSGSFNIEQGLAYAPSPARRRPSPTPTTSA
jgi:hypothetical protein